MPTQVQSSTTFERYGIVWDASYNPLEVELWMIQHGGRWKGEDGRSYGLGNFYHYRQAQTICWPEDDHQRWSDLGLKTLLDNDITVFVGPGDSCKTYTAVRWAMIDWWAFPHDTLFIISSTEGRGLELRIWGKVKELFNRARERFPELAGHVLESMKSITPYAIAANNEKGRLLDRGLICVPCVQGGRYVGLGRYVGIKPPGKNGRLRHIGDEAQFMQRSFLTAYANWYGKKNFKGVIAGNPLDPLDPLGRAAEPPEGWSGMAPPEKTAEWKSTFYGAAVVNFVGTDSPNFDFPQDQPPKYDYLISKKKLDGVARTYGKESMEWCSQCVGVLLPGMVGKRVITRELCRQNNAHDTAIWGGTARTKIYAADPAYGGGDRCVGGMLEFGEDADGRHQLCIYPPEIIPINLRLKDKEGKNIIPEDQIAQFIHTRIQGLGIPVENCAYDSFGKGTLGFSFAKVFGNSTPNPIDSGAQPTARPVRFDLLIEDDGVKRHKRCDEHYSKFVTEMWFSVREVIMGGQMKELPMDVMEEGCLREYKNVRGNKYEVEAKEDTRERMGRSPDLFDWLSIGVEMARRLGFKIERLGGEPEVEDEDDRMDRAEAEYREILQSKLLERAA